MSRDRPKYCFDSSTWIFIGRCLPLGCELFKGAWAWLENLAKNRELITPDVVLFEVTRKDKSVERWITANGIAVPSDPELIGRTNDIMRQFEHLVSEEAKAKGFLGDPYVIALALRERAVVVHEEKERSLQRETGRGTTSISRACASFGVRHCQWVDVVAEQMRLDRGDSSAPQGLCAKS